MGRGGGTGVRGPVGGKWCKWGEVTGDTVVCREGVLCVLVSTRYMFVCVCLGEFLQQKEVLGLLEGVGRALRVSRSGAAGTWCVPQM